jgi:HAD superfamily hydrolase (TIGR01484 family)
MLRKGKAFIIFTDLDKTFVPYDYKKDVKDFLTLIRDIKNRENVDVKFCPISGRPGAYVRRLMHEWRDHAKMEGLQNIFEFGAGEQGAVIVDGKKSYQNYFLGNPEYTSLKKEVAEIVKKNKYGKFIADEDEKHFTCSLHIRDEIGEKLTGEQKKKIYQSLRDDVVHALGEEKAYASMAHNCLEVIPTGVSKHESINWIIHHYRKEYEIVGITFSGDAENDKSAISYVSKLAEIPGSKAHVFLPGNAVKEIDSMALEGWKEKNKNASANRIKNSDLPLFAGVIKLMRKALKENTLVSAGIKDWKTKDDLALVKTNHSNLLKKLQNDRSKDTGSIGIFI